ncbi:hypothetical protein D3C72_564670 [compost metagenome]
MMDRKIIHIDLHTGLHLIAAIDEQQGAIFKDQRQPRRAVKAGQPRQFFEMWCAVFALPRIRARHDHAVEAVFL